jgi:hypothetical protein
MAFYTNVGPVSGPLLAGAGYFIIRVLPAPQAQTPIGTALATSQDEQDVQLWSVKVHGILVPGLWIVVDREFWPAR